MRRGRCTHTHARTHIFTHARRQSTYLHKHTHAHTHTHTHTVALLEFKCTEIPLCLAAHIVKGPVCTWASQPRCYKSVWPQALRHFREPPLVFCFFSILSSQYFDVVVGFLALGIFSFLNIFLSILINLAVDTWNPRKHPFKTHLSNFWFHLHLFLRFTLFLRNLLRHLTHLVIARRFSFWATCGSVTRATHIKARLDAQHIITHLFQSVHRR